MTDDADPFPKRPGLDTVKVSTPWQRGVFERRRERERERARKKEGTGWQKEREGTTIAH